MPIRIIAALVLACASLGAIAQGAWPLRPVKMVVPFPAGGPTDVMTRALADKLSTALGQPVVIDNKPGAGGTIGSDLVAKSAPDGYTLLMATGSTHSVGPYLGKVPYDPQKDFTPIVYVGTATNILLVSPKLGVSNVRELIALAKQKPGELNYSTSGIGSVAHLTSEMFAAMAGVKLTHVPYKGTQQSIGDLASGQVALLFDNVMTAKPHVESGRLKGIAISSAKRSELVPEIPTVGESGLPGFESSNWFGIFAPAHAPQAVVDRVNAEVNRILKDDPSIRERFHTLGFETRGGTPQDLDNIMKSEARKWSKVIRDANVKPE
jgi:tripartite-type tricarboxylate transporter receptor subunit TctC